MKKLAWSVACAALAATTFAQTIKNDLVYGYSRSNPVETLDLYRDGGSGPSSYFPLGNPWATGSLGFIQSVEFDNLNGIQHNAAGNLIGGNFGTTLGGGSIASLATNGTSNGTTIAAFNGSAGYPLTRIGSPAISPKNQKIAVAGYDSGELHVVDYSAGNGNGLTGSTSNPRSTVTGGTIAVVTDTQGSAWLNERTALVFNGKGQLTAVDTNDMSTTIVADVMTTDENEPFSVTDVEFQPAISPYVYAMNGVFNNNTSITTNTLYVFDPRNSFNLVGEFDFSGVDPTDPLGLVMQTTREIAFDSQGNLFVSMFAPTGFVGQNVGVDYIPGAANPANIVSNQSINTPFIPLYGASFNGIDVANSTVIVPGDGNNDGAVTGADYTIWADNFGYGSLPGPTEGLATVQMGDFNCDGAVTGADYTIWADNFGAMPGPTASGPANSVPEPSSLALGALGLVVGLLAARRRGSL